MADKNQIMNKVIGVPITKYYKSSEAGEPLLVRGKFTSDNVDEVGDIITRGATERALPAYRQWGNIRYMHQPRPVGKVSGIGTDDGFDWNEVEIKVIDPQAAFEVENGLLSALSVGIAIKFDDIEFLEDGGWIINDYSLAEISLVDHPANYDATLDVGMLSEAFRMVARESGFTAAVKQFGMPNTKIKEEAMADTQEVILEEETTEEVAEEKDLETEEVATEEVVEEEEEKNIEAEVEVETEAAVETEEVEAVEDVETELSFDEAVEDETTVEYVEASVFNEFAKNVLEGLATIQNSVQVNTEVPQAEEQEVDEQENVEADALSELKGMLEELTIKYDALAAELAELKKPAERKSAVKPVEVAEEVAEEDIEEVDEPTDLRSAAQRFLETR